MDTDETLVDESEAFIKLWLWFFFFFFLHCHKVNKPNVVKVIKFFNFPIFYFLHAKHK